jgi:hypothetical protein
LPALARGGGAEHQAEAGLRLQEPGGMAFELVQGAPRFGDEVDYPQQRIARVALSLTVYGDWGNVKPTIGRRHAVRGPIGSELEIAVPVVTGR